MKPRLMHQEAMDYSFKAKKAMIESKYTVAFDLYKKAAHLESQVADFYLERPDLEPTRSIVIRSAAFLNLKAGCIEKAQKFIFFGLLNITDSLIRSQLNDALEVSVSIKNASSEEVSEKYSYLNLLRQRGVHYIIKPSNLVFGDSVSLESIKDFSENYLKSLKAFAVSKFKAILDLSDEITDSVTKEWEKLINPLIISSGYGSFKFSIANDFLRREGENKEIVDLKSDIIQIYHNNIFTNPLSDEDIDKFKQIYSEEEINEIFRPLTKIRSNKAPYEVGFYDSENFNKRYSEKIINSQRKKLLPSQTITQEDIGELENSIIHKRNSQSGKVTKKTIFKQQLKSAEFDIKIDKIEPIDYPSILLNEETSLTINFNSNIGFTISFDDLRIEYSDIRYEEAIKGLHLVFYNKLLYLVSKEEKNEEDLKDWDVAKRLIANLDAFGK